MSTEKLAPLAIIGGSGLYQMPGLEQAETHEISTPFGAPSAPLVTGRLVGMPVIFLARHGLGHHISPTEINYRANIYALKSLGAQQVVSISACGSLREDYAPGHMVVPDQLFDFTRDRKRTFFEGGVVAHISVAEPFCSQFSDQVYRAAQQAAAQEAAPVHRGGSFITIEGPRFSTKAESNTYRQWGMSLIGMTTSPEAFLAREAELCYAVLAHVTDYDVWHVTEQAVTVDMVIEVLNRNTHLAQQAIANLARSIANGPDERTCSCSTALASALITNPASIPAETRRRLGLLLDKYTR